MLLCSIHSKVYVSWLKRWLPADSLDWTKSVIPVIEGVCDECLATAKACMFVQFPELYVHESLLPY
jgi:hypothetical protein